AEDGIRDLIVTGVQTCALPICCVIRRSHPERREAGRSAGAEPLRAFELCDLQWHQVELAAGRLHVRRVKSGTPSVHPLQGDELRSEERRVGKECRAW